MVLTPGLANEDSPEFVPPRPPNPDLLRPPPKTEPPIEGAELPPKTDLLELPPRAANPPAVELEELGGDAKPEGLLPLVAAAKGEFAPEPPIEPNGEVVEAAKLPNPEDLNLSSLVWGGSGAFLSVVVEAFGLDDNVANGDAAEKLAKPLVGGICSNGQ